MKISSGHFFTKFTISQYYSKIQIFQKKNSLKALKTAGSGSNLGFNYSHLEKQDKESLTDLGMNCSACNNQPKKYSGSRSAGAHRRGPANFFVPNPRKTSILLLLEQEICSNYSIRRWSFLFIMVELSILLIW
jgi:hypothetical protein